MIEKIMSSRLPLRKKQRNCHKKIFFDNFLILFKYVYKKRYLYNMPKKNTKVNTIFFFFFHNLITNFYAVLIYLICYPI